MGLKATEFSVKVSQLIFNFFKENFFEIVQLVKIRYEIWQI